MAPSQQENPDIVDIVVRELSPVDLPDISWSGSRLHVEHVAKAIERGHRGEVVVLGIWLAGELLAKGGIDFAANPGTGKLWMLNVHPSHQSMGIGTLLVHELEDRARRLGVHIAELTVEVGNTRAEALYERLGYTVVGDCDESWEQFSDAGDVEIYQARCHLMRKPLD